jgi:hypothetical protein
LKNTPFRLKFLRARVCSTASQATQRECTPPKSEQGGHFPLVDTSDLCRGATRDPLQRVKRTTAKSSMRYSPLHAQGRTKCTGLRAFHIIIAESNVALKRLPLPQCCWFLDTSAILNVRPRRHSGPCESHTTASAYMLHARVASPLELRVPGRRRNERITVPFLENGRLLRWYKR